MKLKFCIFNNDFKGKLRKVTYIGYIWNYLGQRQIHKLKNITYWSQKVAYFLIFNDPAYTFLDDAYGILLHNR